MGPAEYILTIRAQTVIFLGSCLLGIGLGVLLDGFRLLRILIPHSALAVLLEDAVYAAACAVLLQCYAVSFGSGRLELWMPFGAMLGLLLYLLTFGMLLMRSARFLRGKCASLAKKCRPAEKTSRKALDRGREMRYNKE